MKNKTSVILKLLMSFVVLLAMAVFLLPGVNVYAEFEVKDSVGDVGSDTGEDGEEFQFGNDDETECSHTYEAVVTAPTCTEQGYTTYTCTECGDSYVDDYTDATGHNYVTSTTKATTSKAGSIVTKCSVCGDVKSTTAIAKIASVSLSKTSYTYTGSAFKPSVTVKDSAGKTVSSSDYTVTYSSNTNAGTASVKVTFKGNYSGTTTKTFKITAQAVKSANVSLSTTSYVYSGSARKPSVTAKNSAGKKISSSYYTVSYSSNKNVGKATVTVKFKGNYSGTIKKTFTIKPKATSITKKTARSKGFVLVWKKISSQATGYQIQYSTSSKFASGKTTTKTVTSYKTTTKAYTKLKSKTKYYIRIRTYKTVSGTKYYSAWSKTVTVTTKK